MRGSIQSLVPKGQKRMLTLFTTAKPFRGDDLTRQRNALHSWTLLHPDCEVILFGDVPGGREVAAELGIRHVPDVLRSEYGSVRLDDMFARAQEMARHNLLCYANCDIIFLDSFAREVAAAADCSKTFLMIGQRWDTPIEGPINFAEPSWQMHLREEALRAGKMHSQAAVDYFVFSRGLYSQMPPFVIGRVYWDHWLVWRARSMGAPVVDATADVLAIHQNHDHSYHPAGLEGLRIDAESKRNRALAGGQWHLYTIEHATHRLIDGRVEDKPRRWHVPFTFFLGTYASQAWYWILKSTFKLRHALGLHRSTIVSADERARTVLDE